MIGDTVNGELILSGSRRIVCRVRRSVRARQLRLTLSSEGDLLLTLPDGISRAAADDFVRSSIPWIERTLLKLSLKGRRRKLPEPPSFPVEFVFPVTQERFHLSYEWKNVCWTGVREADGVLLVTGRVLNAEMVREALRRYLLRKAELVLTPLLRRLAEEYDFRTGKISFRFQRGRWGSCSPARDLSLNAQMLFLSPEEVRYIMLHELCHTREMNHSDRFWREVRRYCPDYRRIRLNLRRVRPGLWQS